MYCTYLNRNVVRHLFMIIPIILSTIIDFLNIYIYISGIGRLY